MTPAYVGIFTLKGKIRTSAVIPVKLARIIQEHILLFGTSEIDQL